MGSPRQAAEYWRSPLRQQETNFAFFSAGLSSTHRLQSQLHAAAARTRLQAGKETYLKCIFFLSLSLGSCKFKAVFDRKHVYIGGWLWNTLLRPTSKQTHMKTYSTCSQACRSKASLQIPTDQFHMHSECRWKGEVFVRVCVNNGLKWFSEVAASFWRTSLDLQKSLRAVNDFSKNDVTMCRCIFTYRPLCEAWRFSCGLCWDVTCQLRTLK